MAEKQLNLFDINDEVSIYSLLSKEFLPNDTSEKKVATSNQKVDTSRKVTTFLKNTDNQLTLSRKVASSTPKVDTSNQKVDTLDPKVDTSDKKLATRTKMNREQLEAEIMKVCQNEYIKMEEVATILGKSVDYLKNKIFPIMMKDGKLEKRFPFTHNHPEQGYKTSEEYAKKL